MSTWIDLKNNPRLKEIIITRSAIIRAVREFFWSQNFIETEAPLAVRYPGQEPYLSPMPLTFHNERGEPHQFYLHTSPEFSLKKLLAAGFEKIFHITKTFRDYESFGGAHNPEFTMIEWYRAPGSYHDFMDDTEAMFKYVAAKLNISELRYEDLKVNVNDTWERVSMKDLWKKYLDVNLDELLSIESIGSFAHASGYEVTPDYAYEDIFFKIFLNKIEPHLGTERPLFVTDYPIQMCSLSRPCPADPRYGERAELYIAGLEIANGFGELTDATDQLRRLEADRALRAKLSKPVWPVDPDFIAALQSGIQPAGGIALGIDRMVVLFTGAHSINEVIFQSAADQSELK